MIELNKINCIDCIKGLKEIPTNSVDFVLTDPPFNVGINYGIKDDDYNDERNNKEYSEWCKEWIEELERVLKDGSYCVIFSGDLNLYWILKSVYETKFNFHHFLKWNKPTCQRGLKGTVFFCRTELAILVSKGIPNLKKNIDRKKLYQDTIKCENSKPNDKFGSVNHNCRRPEKLYRQIIEGLNKQGGTVLDCFMGSGTTAVACKQLGRNFIGFEINPEYVKIANKRLAQEVLELTQKINSPTSSDTKARRFCIKGEK